MTSNFKKLIAVPACALLALSISACSDNEDPPPPPPPAPAPPAPTATTFDVTPCLTQEVAPGYSVASLVIPDTVKVFLDMPSGFPNGRLLSDPTINRTLNVLFLDLDVHPATTFENFDGGEGLNNNENDRAFNADFPFLAPPQGQDVYNASAGGSGFTFQTGASSRIERMGQPAVSTALVRTENKVEYNLESPRIDLTGEPPFFQWGPEFALVLTGYTNALADDLLALDLTPCAVPDDS